MHDSEGSSVSKAHVGPSSIGRLRPEARAVIQQLAVPKPARSVLAYFLTYAAVVTAAVLAERVQSLAVYLAVLLFIGARQHSLYILNHDAAHGSLFRSRKVNRWVATLLSNCTFFHHPEAWSYVQWRRVHFLHHGHLFTSEDPNYAYRAEQSDTSRSPSRLALLLRCSVNGPRTLVAWLYGSQDYVQPRGTRVERRIHHALALVTPYADDPEMHAEQRVKIIAMLAIAAIATFAGGWRELVLYWFVPMYTVYPAILHFMDLTEHRWESPSICLTQNTRSHRLSLWERLFVSELPRTLHAEHHVFATVPVHELPRLSRVLVEGQILPPPSIGVGSVLRELRLAGPTHRIETPPAIGAGPPTRGEADL